MFSRKLLAYSPRRHPQKRISERKEQGGLTVCGCEPDVISTSRPCCIVPLTQLNKARKGSFSSGTALTLKQAEFQDVIWLPSDEREPQTCSETAVHVGSFYTKNKTKKLVWCVFIAVTLTCHLLARRIKYCLLKYLKKDKITQHQYLRSSGVFDASQLQFLLG